MSIHDLCRLLGLRRQIFGDIHRLGVRPQPLQAIELPALLGEHVDHHRGVVQQRPLAAPVALDVVGLLPALDMASSTASASARTWVLDEPSQMMK